MMDKTREALVRVLEDAQENLRCWDIARDSRPTHEEGCPCMRATCTLARLPPINDPEIAEALEDVGLEDVGYEPDMTQELLAALEALLGDVRETTLHWKMVHDPMAVPSMRAALGAIAKAKGGQV